MGECKPIKGLKLDAISLAALKRINEKPALGNKLSILLSIGFFSNIFTKNKAPVVALNITQTEWDAYAKSMKSIPFITRTIIQKEIDLMRVHYTFPGNYDSQYVKFWEGMSNGCR